MLHLIRHLLSYLARGVLSLRYRVRVRGLAEVRKLEGPLLILPNHPAYVDPPIVLSSLFRALQPRPLLYEGHFKNPLLYLFMPLLDALRVPGLDQASAEARARTEAALDGVKQALREGQNVILWPAGHITRTGVEKLGANRTVSDVLREVPETKVVLVKTRGLWGSRFSWGWDGQRPPLGKRLLRGVGLLLANLLFFAPRREVEVTLEPGDRSRLPAVERDVVNPWLEEWYNSDPETPNFVRGHFLLGPRSREFPTFQAAEVPDLSQVPAETRGAVDDLVAERLNRPVTTEELTAETGLDQLGMDSLDRMELTLTVERRFGFTGDQVPGTMGQLYALAAGLAARKPPKPPPAAWFSPPSTEESAILGATIPEAFVSRALSCRKDIACADDLSGALTYERLLVGALSLASRMQELPGKNVGVLLPASVACDVTLLALYLADKLPVVLNWTTGPASLRHAVELMGLRHVVTSRAFLDRTGVEVPGAEPVLLEEMKKRIGKVELLWTLLKARWLPGAIRNSCPKIDPDSPAVVLFTSGSEKAPKAVPLSHRNLLLNQQGGIGVLRVTRRDSILGFLPAFHSFGLSITGLFPLLAGVRVARHPDPTDAAALARKVGLYQTTILVGTPTFASYVLERARPGELKSLRMVIVGAEKCPAALFDRFAEAAPGARVLEGYGITECSPVVSVNPWDANRPGTVGQPMPGVEVRVVDLESGQVVPAGKRGMLQVAGPTVFAGYIGEGASPFREDAGKRWYVTGDLVEIDADGYIHFSGRLKRFLKAAGEMISLPALEEPFARLFPPTEDGPRVAVEGVELGGGGRRVVLFTTEAVSLREANDVLLREGFHGVMRLDEVRRVDSLPTLGKVKTDYKVLRAQVV